MNIELMRLALDLVSRDEDDEAGIHARRAISTAYYALFHTLAVSNADLLAGAGADQKVWGRVYRALEHAAAKRILTQYRDAAQEDLSYFARIFVEMQERRHAADYDPLTSFDLDVAKFLVVLAREAATRFALTPAEHRLDLATQLLFKSRP